MITPKILLKKIINYWMPVQSNKMDILQSYSESKPQIYFIQIGSNDGNDEVTPLRRKFGWKGIMIEPLRDVFEQMVLFNARDLGIVFENCAISQSTGNKTIYRVGISNAKWATALTSFDPKVIKAHLRNGFIQECAKGEGIDMPKNEEKIIKSELIKTLTFSDLLAKYKISDFDILLIDTEGYDYEILKLIDFKITKPSIIIYENKHLPRKTYKNSIALLKRFGYRIFGDGSDTIAVNKEVRL